MGTMQKYYNLITNNKGDEMTESLTVTAQETALKGLHEAQDLLAVKLWELYKKLGGSYKSSQEQFEDMVKLGEMGQGMLSIRESIQACMKHL